MIYVDYNATTPLASEVLESMQPYLTELFANPSSLYQGGRLVREAVEGAREQVAALAGCPPRQLIFTSGGTESNNAAITSAVEVTRKRHVVASMIEHAAVKAPLEQLEQKGYRVSWVPTDSQGRVSIESIEEVVTEETGLVCVMGANNETGVIQPYESVGRFCRERNIVFHCDAVQLPGKVSINLDDLEYDSMAFSAHKLRGPKGIGALAVHRRTAFYPFLFGGGQERGRRAGTENVAAIVGFGEAARISQSCFRQETGSVRDFFEDHLKGQWPQVEIAGENADRLPNTSLVCFPEISNELMLARLDQEGICASAGSACTAGSTEPSHVLLAMGWSRERAGSSVRFSFGPGQTRKDAEGLLEAINRILNELLPENRSE